MADANGNTYGPYDIEVAGSESEPFTEAAWYLMHRESGVHSGGALTFTGLTAHLAAFEMRVHGSFLSREDPWDDASPATSTLAPRRDMLVARRQLTSGEGESAVPGKTFLTVLRGTPASTPADPTFDEDDDEPLWSWQVPGSGGTTVTGIRDLRRFLKPIDFPFGAGTWSNYAAYGKCRVSYEADTGCVEILGFVRSSPLEATPISGSNIGILPRRYRPAATEQFYDRATDKGTFHIIEVRPDGQVNCLPGPPPNAAVDLRLRFQIANT